MKDFVEEIGRVAKRCRRCGYDAEALHEMLVNREAECDIERLERLGELVGFRD